MPTLSRAPLSGRSLSFAEREEIAILRAQEVGVRETARQLRKALRVNKAFQQVLDDPEAATALQQPALKPLLDEAADSS